MITQELKDLLKGVVNTMSVQADENKHEMMNFIENELENEEVSIEDEVSMNSSLDRIFDEADRRGLSNVEFMACFLTAVE